MQLESIPSDFADYFLITEASAQTLLSIVVLLSVILPIMLLSKGRNTLPLILFMGFLTECLLVGIGWLPFWILIATVAVMAIAIAFLGTSVVVGGE